MENSVIILMATFNGAKYLREQLDSIISQSFEQWELYVRDDQSTDATLSILAHYAAQDKRIKILSAEGPHGSPALNFAVLFNTVTKAEPGYIMLADQDDVWAPEKIKVMMDRMQYLERGAALMEPLLLYSDFQYVDELAMPINQELALPLELTMPMLLAANYAYGCTMLCNRALVKRIGQIPFEAVYHDYWIALVATTFGKAIKLPQKLVKYRQHHTNSSTTVKNRTIQSRVKRYITHQRDDLHGLIGQHQLFEVFLATFKANVAPQGLALMANYMVAFKQSTWKLFSLMYIGRIRKLGTLQNLAHLYRVLRFRREIISH